MEVRIPSRLCSQLRPSKLLLLRAHCSKQTTVIRSLRSLSAASARPAPRRPSTKDTIRRHDADVFSLSRRARWESSSSSSSFTNNKPQGTLSSALTDKNSSSSPSSTLSSDASSDAEFHATNPFGLRQQGTPQEAAAPEPDARGEVPAYELTFTCKPCLTRSSHRISKHGYHNGTVLITCPSCRNRHVISDHLRIFNDAGKSFEDILREKGELLRTGVLDPDQDIEFWDDGSQTARKKEGEGGEAEVKAGEKGE